MRKVGAVVVTGAIVGMAMMGCSSSSSGSDPYGGTPDFASIQQEFRAPTGTFAGHENAAFNAFSQQQSNSNSLSGFTFGAGGGTTAQSFVNTRLRTLGVGTASSASCDIAANGSSSSGSCTCHGGGSLSYDLSGLQQYTDAAQKGGPVDATIKIAASGCKSQDGTESVDGKIFENFRGTVPAPGTTQDPKTADFAIMLDAHVTAQTPAAGSVHVDLDVMFAALNGLYSEYFVIHVDDGTEVIGGQWDANTKTGSITVTDKNGTWTCTGDGKVAHCTGTGNVQKTVTL